MNLSVIIVNYNVKLFLEQCLCSVQKAIAGITAEIIVVDNCSADNSIDYLQPKFPTVQFIANEENLGFAKGCNMGLKKAEGKFILFLNPDTLVPEDCFEKCISFLESHADAGALGIKMLDGRGKFLKESKRSFPSPMTSLYKLFGLSKLFPRSKVFSKYHLEYLNEDENHEVDVLAGAFMMVKKEVLEKVGSFDEIFFMYGEDVDLSYRIQKAGYKNYYFAESSIIHFKGESTRKGSMNYVRMFYNAMSIFVRKHYGGRRAGIFNFLIHIAIWIRAFLSAASHFIRRVGLPLIDAGLILLSFWLMKNIWSHYVRTGIEYERRLLWVAFPAYTVLFLITAYYAGLYDRWYKRSELLRSMLLATIILLAGYALLPERFRFSRGILLFGSVLAFTLISLLRWLLIRTNVLNSNRDRDENASTLIIASPGEYQQAVQLIKEAGLHERILGRIAVAENDESAVGYWKKLSELSSAIPFREVVFCEGSLSFSDIIQHIPRLPSNISIKFHASDSSSIVGSDSKNTLGEVMSKENEFKLGNPYNRRLKRLTDIFISLLGILAFPVHLFFIKKPFLFFANCIAVLFAQKTWIGYAVTEKNLPLLRKGIIACNGAAVSAKHSLPAESLQMVDYWYARDYEPAKDLKLLWRMYRSLGS
ncbi:MAG TPA: glycosyltransferase [Chitinophagaceae bacterium]